MWYRVRMDTLGRAHTLNTTRKAVGLTPTRKKHAEVLQGILEANKPMPQASRDVGYTSGSHLKGTKSFEALLDGILPDKTLLEAVKRGIEATRSTEEGSPDMAVRHKFIVTALELKGHLRKDTVNNTLNVFSLTALRDLRNKSVGVIDLPYDRGGAGDDDAGEQQGTDPVGT